MSELVWYGRERERDIKDKLLKNMGKVVSVMDLDIKQSMISTPRGLPDKSARSGSRSLPGQPPAVQTTALIGSIFTDVGEKGNLIIGRVGSKDVNYAKAMEFGLPKKGVAHRPWLFPALERIRSKIRGILAND
jgi:hypothetical protein